MDLTKLARHGERLSVTEAHRRIAAIAHCPEWDHAGLEGTLATLVNAGVLVYDGPDTVVRTNHDVDTTKPVGWIKSDPGPIVTTTEPFVHDAAYEAAHDAQMGDLARLIDQRIEAVLKAHGLIN